MNKPKKRKLSEIEASAQAAFDNLIRLVLKDYQVDDQLIYLEELEWIVGDFLVDLENEQFEAQLTTEEPSK